MQYEVKLERKTTETTYVLVEAKSEEYAYEKAEAMAKKNPSEHEWKLESVDFDYLDVTPADPEEDEDED